MGHFCSSNSSQDQGYLIALALGDSGIPSGLHCGVKGGPQGGSGIEYRSHVATSAPCVCVKGDSQHIPRSIGSDSSRRRTGKNKYWVDSTK